LREGLDVSQWGLTMNRYEMRLQEMGVTLPEMPTPIYGMPLSQII
jgi:hypothetical protein